MAHINLGYCVMAEDTIIKIKLLVLGLLTYIPGVPKILLSRGTGGTNSASYCYGVWLKHLTMLWENGSRSIPNTVAEIGPGESIGIGLSALLSGVNHYYALDVVRYASPDLNLKIFDQLVELFKARAGRPAKGWPDYDKYLDNGLFPSHILTKELLKNSLSDERVSLIRNALLNPNSRNKKSISIKYAVPWTDDQVIGKETVDVIVSHSVLEHVVDLDSAYKTFNLWLKPEGMMSHQIDFKSHGLSKKWNGYRGYSEKLWKIIMGKRLFMINRQPCSVHENFFKNNSFKITCQLKKYESNGIQRSLLSSHWKDISEDDLACSSVFIQAQKQ